jgi:hypothetical protein
MSQAFQLSKKASQSFAAEREKESNHFSGDIALEKIHLGLQTCELCAAGAQQVR